MSQESIIQGAITDIIVQPIWGTLDGGDEKSGGVDISSIFKALESQYYPKKEIDTLLSGKANSIHNHNDIYYLKTDIDTLLSGKANAIHNHNDIYYLKTDIDTLLSDNYVNKSGDTMLGRLKFSSDGFETNHDDGYVTDAWGNFIHKSANRANYWGIYNNAVENKFRVFFETGDVTTEGGNISIIAPPNSARLIFKNPSKSNRGVMLSFAEDDDNNVSRFYFYQMKSNNGNYDLFKLPKTDLSETTNGIYDILTDKSPVTIEQGGTGATDRLAALKALTNQNVGSSATHFLAITTNWKTGGYVSKADAWTALGGGTIGKKNSLAASDIPNLPASKITDGTLALAHGGTGGTDSEWKSFSASGTFTGTVYYRKIGYFGEIYAYGIKLANDLTSDSGITLGSINGAYAPSKGFMQVFGSSYTSGLINVSSAGVVKLYKDRNISALKSTWTIYWNVMYLL